MLRSSFGAVRRALAVPAARGMAVSSQSVLYTAKGVQADQSLSMAEETFQLDAPGGSQVLVKFLASACSPHDIASIMELHPPSTGISSSTVRRRYASAQAVEPFSTEHSLPSAPAIGGLEGVAVVEAVGSSVKGLSPGDWVLPAPGVGTWRTHAVVDAAALTPVPSDIPAEYAAVLGQAPATALRLLDDFGKMSDGDYFVLNGAESLVGQALIQIGVARGLKPIALIAMEGEICWMSAHLKAIGAAVVIPYEHVSTYQFQEIVAELPAAKIGFDGVGGKSAAAMAKVLPKGGTIVSYGAETSEVYLIAAGRETKVVGFSYPEWSAKASQADKATMMVTLAGMVKDGTMKLLLETMAFRDYQLALRLAREWRRERRIVLTMP